mmetsp:Transcript_7402/g.10504  ORF Transcript_7402/g.10504 Transcript_7402/m.10504 type:complete len:148 (+) Transcript_7402:114-557(+)
MGQACSSGCSDGNSNRNDLFEVVDAVPKAVAFDENLSQDMSLMAPLASFDTEETDLVLDLENDTIDGSAASEKLAAAPSSGTKEITITTTTKKTSKNQKRKSSKNNSSKKNSSKKNKSGKKQSGKTNKHKSKKAGKRKTYSDALLGY